MQVKVDPELCISCGLCIETCPEVFAWNKGEKAEAVKDPVPAGQEDCCREAIDGCPTQAIAEI